MPILNKGEDINVMCLFRGGAHGRSESSYLDQDCYYCLPQEIRGMINIPFELLRLLLKIADVASKILQ